MPSVGQRVGEERWQDESDGGESHACQEGSGGLRQPTLPNNETQGLVALVPQCRPDLGRTEGDTAGEQTQRQQEQQEQE